MNKSQGTVDFVGADDDKKKGKRKLGDKKAFNKFSGKSSSGGKKFRKEDGGKGGAAGKGAQDEKASRSQIRRQKQKVSDLIKKLRIIYNKLLMKK